MKLNTIEEAIEDFRQGKFLIVVDDEDRENEGDFIVAAEKITPEKVNFMLKEGRGVLCAPLIIHLYWEHHSQSQWIKLKDAPQEFLHTIERQLLEHSPTRNQRHKRLENRDTSTHDMHKIKESLEEQDIQRLLLTSQDWQDYNRLLP